MAELVPVMEIEGDPVETMVTRRRRPWSSATRNMSRRWRRRVAFWPRPADRAGRRRPRRPRHIALDRRGARLSGRSSKGHEMTDTEETLHYCAYLSYSWDVEGRPGLARRWNRSWLVGPPGWRSAAPFYATTAFRAECDILFWLLADSTLKSTRQPGRSDLRARSRPDPVLERDRRPSKPSSTGPTSPPSWPASRLAVSSASIPFVRSLGWYLLGDEERRELLARHGMLARDYKGRAGQHGQHLRTQRLRVAARLQAK